jgi:hypothetical protein
MAAADGLLPQAGAERLLLLREAIAMQPGGFAETEFATPLYFTGKDLALKIFVDEAAARHDATALVVIEPMLAGSNGGMYSDSGANIYAANSQASASDGEANSGDEATEAGDSDEALELGDATLAELERAAPLPGTHPLKEAEKLRLATLIAQVYEGTDSATGALPYLRLAHCLQEDKAQASALQQHIDEVARTLWLEAQNASRRPVIQKALHQGGVVRPRLTSTDAAHMEAQ